MRNKQRKFSMYLCMNMCNCVGILGLSVTVCQYLRKHKDMSEWECESGVYGKCECVSAWKYECINVCGSKNLPVCSGFINIIVSGEKGNNSDHHYECVQCEKCESKKQIWLYECTSRQVCLWECVWILKGTKIIWDSEKFSKNSHVSSYRQIT